MKKIKDPRGYKGGIYRTIRGGDFRSSHRLKSSTRTGDEPNNRFLDMSFRLIVKHNEKTKKP